MNKESINSKPRLAWVDWIKVIAMYFIIAGHMFPPGNKYRVPCFFIL